MFSPLYSSRKHIASFTLSAFVMGFAATIAPVQASAVLPNLNAASSAAQAKTYSIEPVTLQPKGIEIAHHGGEGGSFGGGAIGGSSAVTGAASTVGVITGQVSKASASDSLWGNFLLSMAYQRDPVINRYAKKMGYMNVFTFLTIAGVTGLGLAQGIRDFHENEPQDAPKEGLRLQKKSVLKQD
jgi:hypothetical protein